MDYSSDLVFFEDWFEDEKNQKNSDSAPISHVNRNKCVGRPRSHNNETINNFIDLTTFSSSYISSSSSSSPSSSSSSSSSSTSTTSSAEFFPSNENESLGRDSNDFPKESDESIGDEESDAISSSTTSFVVLTSDSYAENRKEDTFTCDELYGDLARYESNLNYEDFRRVPSSSDKTSSEIVHDLFTHCTDDVLFYSRTARRNFSNCSRYAKRNKTANLAYRKILPWQSISRRPNFGTSYGSTFTLFESPMNRVADKNFRRNICPSTYPCLNKTFPYRRMAGISGKLINQGSTRDISARLGIEHFGSIGKTGYKNGLLDYSAKRFSESSFANPEFITSSSSSSSLRSSSSSSLSLPSFQSPFQQAVTKNGQSSERKGRQSNISRKRVEKWLSSWDLELLAPSTDDDDENSKLLASPPFETVRESTLSDEPNGCHLGRKLYCSL